MSNNRSDHSGSGPPTRYQSADEIVRFILDDHASHSSEISPSGELYRAIERFQANAHRRAGLLHSARRELARSHLNRWASASATGSASPPGTRPALQNDMSSDNNGGSDSRDVNQGSSGVPSLPPLRSITNGNRRSAALAAFQTHTGSRYGWRRAERLIERHLASDDIPESGMRRTRTPQSARDYQHLQTMRALHESMDDGNNELRALLDFATPPPHAYSDQLAFPSPPLQTQELNDDNPRTKRRKLDSDCLSSGFKGFRYGKYGQVEPGALTMEIVSCDGGIYSDDSHIYSAENILKNDSSVYCTKGPRCNIVLRHQGSTVFTLKELVIKAPRHNFSSPVREGMVFVSMNADLLARTARYQISYSRTSSSRRTDRDDQPSVPLLSNRNTEAGNSVSRMRARRLWTIGMDGMDDGDENEYRSAQIPPEFTASPPPFHVTTVCSDDEDDPSMRPFWQQAPNRIGALPFENEEDSGLDDSDTIVPSNHGLRRRRYFPYNLDSIRSEVEASQEAAGGSSSAGEGDLMAAHARFFIEPDKSKCTIKFDPPVSGRFILLKMWSPHPDSTSNIDIQAVVASGFAGPRYFPAVEVR